MFMKRHSTFNAMLYKYHVPTWGRRPSAFRFFSAVCNQTRTLRCCVKDGQINICLTSARTCLLWVFNSSSTSTSAASVFVQKQKKKMSIRFCRKSKRGSIISECRLATLSWKGTFHWTINWLKFKQTVQTLIRRRVLRRLIWACIVCQCPSPLHSDVTATRIAGNKQPLPGCVQ